LVELGIRDNTLGNFLPVTMAAYWSEEYVKNITNKAVGELRDEGDIWKVAPKFHSLPVGLIKFQPS